MDDQIQIASLGRFAIGVEMTGREVGAGKDPDPVPVDPALGQGPRHTDRRVFVIEAEAIEVGLARLQAGGQDFQRAQRLHHDIGDLFAGAEHDIGEVGIACHLDPAIAAAVGCQRRPQDHAGRIRIAGGDTVQERAAPARPEGFGSGRTRAGRKAGAGGTDQRPAARQSGLAHGLSLHTAGDGRQRPRPGIHH